MIVMIIGHHVSTVTHRPFVLVVLMMMLIMIKMIVMAMIMLVFIMTMVVIMIVMIIRHHVSKAVTHLAAYCSVQVEQELLQQDVAGYSSTLH